MNNGWVKIHRSLLDWEWWSDINVRNLWLTILLLANHEEKRWQGQTIQAGQFVTSLQNLSVKSGLSVQSVRTALDKLKSTGEINTQSTNKNTLITVIKWADFQLCDDSATNEQQTNNKPSTNEQQTTNKQSTTNKNDKNIKNEKNKRNIFIKPTLEEVQEYISTNMFAVDPVRFYDYYESNGWKISGRNKMSDWKATVRNWHHRENEKKPKQEQEKWAF